MTESLQPELPAGDDLQFENAEYATEAPSAMACAGCAKEISGSYYEVNGKMLCPTCRDAVVRELGGRASPARFARALLFGTLAAAAGAGIYFGVTKLSQREFSLISILVGFMVGIAVRAGSRHRGGFIYQALAVLLTYIAISASYTAMEIESYFSAEAQQMREAQAKNQAGAAKVAGPDAKAEDVLEGGEPEVGPHEVAQNPLLFLTVVMGLLATAPVLENLQRPIGLLIVAFALWEAWKLNKRTKLEINGPYEAGGHDAPPPKELPSHA